MSENRGPDLSSYRLRDWRAFRVRTGDIPLRANTPDNDIVLAFLRMKAHAPDNVLRHIEPHVRSRIRWLQHSLIGLVGIISASKALGIARRNGNIDGTDIGDAGKKQHVRGEPVEGFSASGEPVRY